MCTWFDSLLWLKFLLEESCHSSVCKHSHEFIHAFIIFIFFFEQREVVDYIQIKIDNLNLPVEHSAQSVMSALASQNTMSALASII
jgi:hypothetical protein